MKRNKKEEKKEKKRKGEIEGREKERERKEKRKTQEIDRISIRISGDLCEKRESFSEGRMGVEK